MTHPKIYYRPKTLVEAIERAAQPNCAALVGGALAFGVLEIPYEVVVDLQDLKEIQQIETVDSTLRIGGAVKLTQLIESPLVPSALKQSLTRATPPNLRNNISVGETLMVSNTSMLREWLAMLRLMDAVVEYAGQETGEVSSLWNQPLQDFVQFVYERGGHFGGLIAYVHLPAQPPFSVFSSAVVSRTPADAPIINAAAMLTFREDGAIANAGAVVCGASATPVLFLDLKILNGQPLDETSIDRAVRSVPVQVNPVGDYLGSADYRREMARVCVRRALMDCMAQLKSIVDSR
jgi:CO/xanthine dehydrogenase FAD-binding subunit